MKKISNKKIGAVCGVAAIALIVGSTMAYFSDRADTSQSGKAGSLELSLDDTALKEGLGASDLIIDPADMISAGISVENIGNKSMQTRTTVVLQSSVAMDKTADQAEYELYYASDVELVEGKGYAPKAGAKPLQTRSISEDGTKITYNLPEYTLNGNESFAVRETEDGVDTDSHTYDIVLVMKDSASNAFQESTVTVSYLVEGRQFRNTSGGWDIVAQETYTFAGEDVSAVVAK